MVRKTIYGALVLAAALAVWSLMAAPAAAQVRTSSPGDLFYNYYVPPAGYAGVGVQLYPSPRPTPPLVGHTYVTYQPLMPHEFLYPHHRVVLEPPTVWRRQHPDLGHVAAHPKALAVQPDVAVPACPRSALRGRTGRAGTLQLNSPSTPTSCLKELRS